MEFEYVCYPTPRNNHQVRYSRDGWVKFMLDSIVRLSESQITNPWYQTSSSQAHLGMIGYVAGGFYRQEFDSKFDLWRLPQCRNPEMVKQKKLVDACATLWATAWRVLERMESMGRLPLPPFVSLGGTYYPAQTITPLWLMALVMEGELLTPWIDYLPLDGSTGFEALLKQQQNANRRLQAFYSPFDNPCTKLFIDSAKDTSEKFDQFSNNFYKPMIRQRQSVTALMSKERFSAFDMDGKLLRQGRSKNGLNNYE